MWTSGWLPELIFRHAGHRSQEYISPLSFLLSQFKNLATATAVAVLPIYAGPTKRYACARSPFFSRAAKRFKMFSLISMSLLIIWLNGYGNEARIGYV